MTVLACGKSVVCVASFLVCACLANAARAAEEAVATAADDGPWRVIELGARGDLSVRFKVRPQASLADKDWMVIEFENRGDQPIELDGANYRIESARCDPETGEPKITGGLGQGSDHSLFPQAWKSVPVAPRVVPPGLYRVSGYPSMYATALLGLPPRAGWLIKAELHMRVAVKGDGLLVDWPIANEFQFEWTYPDEAGFARARATLEELLKHPEDKVQHAYLLHCLLSVPDVSRELDAAELLAALPDRNDGFSGRGYVLEHLGERYAGDATVVDYFRRRLEAGDAQVAEDLKRAARVWDPSFLEPLLIIFERDPRSWNDVLTVLEQHGTPQKTDAKLAGRLSAGMLQEAKPGELPPRAQLSKDSVMRSLTLLARTRDRALVPIFAAHLDDRTKVVDPRTGSALRLGPLPPMRVCDAALEAIMTVLDDDFAAYRRRFNTGLVSIDEQEKDCDAVRDQAIVELKSRLSKGIEE